MIQQDNKATKKQIRWGSTSKKPLSRAVKRFKNVAAATRVALKTVAEVESFIQTETKIKFNIKIICPSKDSAGGKFTTVQ